MLSLCQLQKQFPLLLVPLTGTLEAGGQGNTRTALSSLSDKQR